jgi:8-oxo-dGTP pyrophosphatase MutT (NUDIX family)
LSDNESFKALVAERAAAKAEAPARKASAATMRPRDAATLIIIDSEGSAPRVLLGKRRDDLKFMPGKYVFPGGRLDADDKIMTAARELRQSETDKLLLDMKGHPSAARARGLAMTAVRETYEEAGIIIGGTAAVPPAALAPPSENPSLESPAAKTWRQFLGHGFAPDLAPLTFLARAITPPGRPRRFDTRFFCVEAAAITKSTDNNDGELSGLVWMTLVDARELDLPPITRVILEDLGERIAKRSLDDPTVPIPYYFNRHGIFRREMLHLIAPVA